MSSFSFDLMSHSRHESGRDLVGHDDPHQVVFPQPAAFHLEVDQADADAEEQPGQEVVDPDGERHDVVDLLRRGPAERGDVLLRDHRVVELVVLVIELDDRARQLGALLDAEPRSTSEPAATLRTTTSSGMISTSRISCSRMLRRRMKCVGTPMSLRRWKTYSEMRLFSTPLPSITSMLLGIEGGGVVLEMLDQGAGLRALVEDLRLAFIDAATAAHRDVPWFEKIHRMPWLQLIDRGPRRRKRKARQSGIEQPIRSHQNLADTTEAVQST